MVLAGWIRDRLWRANDWCAVLAPLRHELTAAPRTTRTLERLFDLAVATEHCDPERGRALALYLEAWRGGHAEARPRVLALAVALRAHLTVAELALADGELVAAGTAFLDAGLPELAVEPLQRFVDARPGGASPATEQLRLDGVRALLALARRTRLDAEAEIAEALARAQHATGRAAAAAYAHAARIARLARLEERRPQILVAATRACPDDDELAGLVEERLLEGGNADELLEHYRARFERCATRAAYVERVQAAGAALIAHGLQPGLGLRLLRMALEHAYAALLPEVPCHLAAWELLVTHARAHQSLLDLVPLIVQALGAPLSEDDALYLARLGLEIAWREAGDTLAAQPYAAMVLDFVPDHPLATAFAKEVVPEATAEASAEATPAPAPEPPPAPTPAPAPEPPPPPTTSSRIPVLEDGPVKRSASPAPAAPHGITGRLALLRPPPPRATSLRRDTSPFPIPPRPRTATIDRAPRKVVPIDVVVELPTGEFFSTVLRDVSTSGAFIITKRALEVGAVVTLELRVPVPGAVKQARHRATARIARRTNLGCGLAFLDPSPELIAAIRRATA